MEQRFFAEWSWARALRDAIIAILATLVYYIVGRLTSFSLPAALFIGVGTIIFLLLTFIGDLLWAQDGFRCAVLTISQRLSTYVAGALFTVAAVTLALIWLSPLLGLPALHFLSSAPADLVEQAMAIGLGAMVLVLCLALDRPTLTAAQCHTVLRRILRQWRTGRYSFDHGAASREIRQESRFLDYLAKKSHHHIKRRWAGYVFSREPGPSTALQSLCPGLAEGDANLTFACVNKHWRQGGWLRNRWRRLGDELYVASTGEDKEGYTKSFFGNNLDMLFNSGVGFRTRLPDGPGFLMLVIKGQPGAGKSTQALQLSATLARHGQYCLYYSLEEERESLLQVAHNFGWAAPAPLARQPSTPIAAGAPAQTVPQYAGVRHLDFERRGRFGRRAGTPPSDPGVWVSSLGDRAMPVAQRKRRLHDEWQRVPQVPRCVVIDSLEGFANVQLDLESAAGVPRAELLSLKDFFRDRCQMLVILVEDDGSGKPGYVDFVADAVIQLGRIGGQDYTLLIAEILKARNQNHALGAHQIKIRSREDMTRATGAIFASLKDLQPGIIVFPSLHYRLFQAQHRPVTDDYVLSTGLDGLDRMLPSIGPGAGVRRQAALALLGPSGTGKSVIALNFLIEGMRENTPTLLLQLHNDPATITSRPIPQEPHRMQFSWQREVDLDTGRPMLYHQFTWTHEGIARWWRARQPARGSQPARPMSPRGQQVEAPADHAPPLESFERLLRLPYLFRLGPLPHPITPEEFSRFSAGTMPASDRRSAIEQAQAVEELLRSVAQYDPPLAADGRTPRWDAHARQALRARFEQAWARFVERVGASAIVAGVEAPHGPKRIQLCYVEGEYDETAPAPFLQWDSRYWEPNKRQLVSAWDPQRSHPGGDGGIMYDTRLLVIRDFRPGNIAPDDFIDRILRDIGEPTKESVYERVVFDDVSQLSQRFPLLAGSPLFLPTVIDMFKATGITSLFLANTELASSESLDLIAQDHGMAILGDHVIRTSHQYVAGNGELLPPNQRGRHSKREIIVESDALPADERQGAHILRIARATSRFVPSEEEELVTVEEPRRISGTLGSGGQVAHSAG